MSDLRLPGLLPDDPKNLLSYASRQRIAKAHMVAERIRTEALSTLQTRYRAEHPAGVSFAEYLRRGSAFVELTESDMKAARTVLGTEAEEYRKLGLPDSRYSEIMRGQIEGAVNSLELSRLQNQMLELEFVWGASGHVDDEGRSAERCEKNISAADRVRTFMDRKGLTIHQFAVTFGISDRTVASVLAGVPVGKRTRVAVANALGSTPEELFRE